MHWQAIRHGYPETRYTWTDGPSVTQKGETLKFEIIAYTTFRSPAHVPWEIEPVNPFVRMDPALGTGQDLAEFAGRACYQSWDRPNPATATNVDYLAHILDVGHESVLEHGSVSVYIEGVSRSLTHELVRHRHFSYSQLSQRYVDETNRDELPVIPPIFCDDRYAEDIIHQTWGTTLAAYDDLVARAVYKGANRKQAREAARSVLMNATETKIVVTGNYRAWRHFFIMRGSEFADAEIRQLALALFAELSESEECGNVFQDMYVADPDTTPRLAWKKDRDA